MQQNKRIEHDDEHGELDPYFTPTEATASLIGIEYPRMPERILEPCVGNGAIANELISRGYIVWGQDIKDWGWRGLTIIQDYATADANSYLQGVVTNPPYKRAAEFVAKAIGEYSYVAMLLRIGFLESLDRKDFLTCNPPSRILIPSRRLPMMHREGWEGKKTKSSNVCHPWFIWDNKHVGRQTEMIFYDWKNYSDGVSSVDNR